jgi:TRAP-type C4-dicarboxylate transport system substrate-binding protein
MNKKSYEKLPPNIQKIFNEISAEWNEKHVLMWNNADLAGYKFGKEKDVTFIDLPKAEAEKWKQKIIPIKTKYMEDMQKKGYSEEQVSSWFKYLDERIEYWRAKQKEKGIKSVVPLD